ncbi:MAG: hypothetical protein ABMA01_16810, partial [Chthoniobacteraceae bacterium]
RRVRCDVDKVFSRLGTVKPPKSVSQEVRAAFSSGIVVNPERSITVFSGVTSLFFGWTVPRGAIGAAPQKRTGTHKRPAEEGKRFLILFSQEERNLSAHAPRLTSGRPQPPIQAQ